MVVGKKRAQPGAALADCLAHDAIVALTLKAGQEDPADETSACALHLGATKAVG
jgi:hypothetical protein